MIFRLLSKTDIMVILIILLSAGASFLYTLNNRNNCPDVIINFNNQVFAIENLSSDKTIKLDSLAVIELSNKKARVSFSTCRNQNCVNQSWSNSLPVVCVPNRIVLEFSGRRRQDKNEMFITH